MPRPPKRSKSRRAGFDDLDITYLLEGSHGLPCAMTDAEDAGDDAAIREAWDVLRDTILPPWISRHPGRRPWGWWTHDAPSRRERIDGRMHPFDCKPRTLYIASANSETFWKHAYALHYGMPGCMLPQFDGDIFHDFMKNVLHGKDSEVFEQEWNYLARLNLLVAEDSP